MRPIFAMIWLTWKAALRVRLVWVLTALLMSSVALLPLLVKDDGTARGFIQILLTYTLSVITALLGFTTIWLACGSLARDVEDCQIQMVAVKPIARWQIWLGKWLGIVLINALLLAISGTGVYVLLNWRASQLSPGQQAILHNEVFVARSALKEQPTDYTKEIDTLVSQKLRENQTTSLDASLLRKQIEAQVKAREQIVPPNYMRAWNIDLGVRRLTLKDQPLYVRVKFFVAQTNETASYATEWQIGPPETEKQKVRPLSLSAESFHEFEIPPNLFDDTGRLTIRAVNRSEVAMLFPLDETLEVLYREGGFALNFMRGLVVILFWLALLAALGLTAASFLSFPVAAFFSLAMLLIGLSSSTLETAIEQNTVLGQINSNTGAADQQTIIDHLMLPLFRGMLTIVKLAESFSPIDSLSSGRSITWYELAQAFAQIVLLLGGIIGGIGAVVFTRRELATAQGTN